MIGNMYEGLTKEMAEKSLFDGMDLKVASGKITNQVDGKISKQIDCMIVIGEGTEIPYTKDYIYDIDQVIMVIEVKKNLYSKELSDGYDNLRSVTNLQKPTRDLKLDPIEDAFRAISGVETVCLLSKLKVEHYIEVEVNLDEMDLTAVESRATYEEIKEYVLEHSGLKVSNLYIA